MSGDTDADVGAPSSVCVEKAGATAGAGTTVAAAAAAAATTTTTTAVAENGEEELVLNREDFAREFSVVAVKIPAKKTSMVQQHLRKELLNLRHRKNVELCEGDASKRLVLLSSDVKDPETLEGLSDAGVLFLREHDDMETTTFSTKTTYKDFGVEQVLTRLLGPRLPGRDLPTSFEAVGHVAHVNLKDHLLPYKKVIGQVIIDKNPRITTVVNKIDTISTQFRTFPMEVIAGESNTEVELREGGCVFRFDFAKVYWNSRLQTEHARLIDVTGEKGKKPAPVVCDMMAGVGPFAIPLAKKGHRVFANDLNPDSFNALRANGHRNKVAGRLTTSNDCGRAFAKRLIEEGQVFHHAILNLPDSALTFLDVFKGVDWKARGFEAPPMVHVYCFSRAADPTKDALDRANEVMGSALTTREVNVHVVRDVAPNKPMMCLSFLAPDAGEPSSIAPTTEGATASACSSDGADAGAGAGASTTDGAAAVASSTDGVGGVGVVAKDTGDQPAEGTSKAETPGWTAAISSCVADRANPEQDIGGEEKGREIKRQRTEGDEESK